MKHNKVKYGLIATAAIVACTFLFKILTTKNLSPEESKKVVEMVEPTMSNFARLAEQEEKATGAKLSNAEKQKHAFDMYLMSNDTAYNINEFGKKVFGEGPQAQAAANWVALTLMLEDSAAYNKMFESQIHAVNQRPAVVLDALDTKADMIRQDSFFHQMVINLVHKLNVPRSTKIKYLANELMVPIQLVNEDPSPAAANVFLAMDFLRLYNATAKELKDVLIKSKSIYALNSKEYFKFRMQAMVMFPGAEEYL